MIEPDNIRVIQLIDSLEPGGAERMAVSLANSLAETIAFSGIVVTREQGRLSQTLQPNVSYLFVDKKSTFDMAALFRLRNFVKANKVQLIHAHSSSYFFAVLLKLTMPSLKLIWHDHLGNRVHLKKSNTILKCVSLLFDGVFTVNSEIEQWGLDNLKTPNVWFLPNFIEKEPKENKQTFLKGETGKRIVMLANLHSPKNHILALNSFIKSKISNMGWTLHFVGKDYYDDYSNQLKQVITTNNRLDSVFLLGSCSDIYHILSQSSVGILVSTYEGFPVTLLEYGNAKLFVITSNVGYCSQVIRNGKTGICFESFNENELIDIFKELANNTVNKEILAQNLNTFVIDNYTADVVINQIVSKYWKIVDESK